MSSITRLHVGVRLALTLLETGTVQVKIWQIFSVGLVAAVALWSFPLYQSAIAGVAAIAVIGVVGTGFWLHPRTEIFYVRTTVWRIDADSNLSSEHEQLAVKVEVARLWLLFLPTSLAMAFLVVTAAHGTLWQIGLLDWIESGYALLIFNRIVLLFIVGALSIWISERRVLRDADACSARSVSVSNGRVSFAFVDRNNVSYGGEGLHFGLVRPPALANLVLYAVRKPELNQIGSGFLFHRLIIIGRGLTDLDQQTAVAHTTLAGMNPWP
jgi:hypothetical protein